MFGSRHEISLRLTTATPTHVGTGEFVPMPPRSGSNDAADYATIVRDHNDLPYIPSTTIKGNLRRLAEEHFPDDAGFVPLFGEIKDSRRDKKDNGKDEEIGVMGQLLVHAGQCDGKFPDTRAMPYASHVKAGAYIAARTAMDGEAGVARRNNLFFQEMLPPGVAFDVRLTLLHFGGKTDAALRLVENLLSIGMRDGLSLGKSQSDGSGRMELSNVSMTEMVLGDDGSLRSSARKTIAKAGGGAVVDDGSNVRHFDLICEMPFSVVDSSVTGEGRDKAKESGTVQVAAQKLRAGQPLLHGSSVSGVLRARALWLAGKEALAGRLVDEDKTPLEAESVVKEMFGTTGQRAKVEIRHLSVGQGKEELITSLKVDRFTGAPVFGALYTSQVFTGVRLSFDLVLASTAKRKVSAAAAGVFKLLCEDTEKNGLNIGHGGNKGFGWFRKKGG
jgi:CRISPR/Cas system CSM-associated protein Csm3 (group 7 of RAMP superfamily)